MRTRILYTSLAIAALLMFVIAACTRSVSDPVVPGKPVYLNLAPDAVYVGRDSCKACHADKYNTFTASEMGRSFHAGHLSDNLHENWHNPAPVYDSYADLWYLAMAKGQDMYIMEYRLAGKDTTFSRTEKINYIVGSGQHTHSHIRDVNGYLYQMPLTWYQQEQKWDLPPGYEKGMNSRFSRAIEIECMTCHNAMPRYIAGTDNRYESIPLGVDCERCHGPGSVHLKQMKTGGDNPYLTDGIDYTIVHPGKLPIDLQFDICQRCHLQGTAVPVEGKSFMDFRPGMKLNEVINVFLPRYEDSLRSFIMASHPDRLRMSRCFISSQAEGYAGRPLTCITCHNPHISIRERGAEVYKSVCENCHKAGMGKTCSAPDASLKAEQYLCTRCHMPPSGSADIPHVRITDHYIRKPDIKLSGEEAGQQKKFLRLACLTRQDPSPRLMAEGYLAWYEQFSNLPQALDSAMMWMEKARKTESDDALMKPLVRLYFLRQDYKSIVELTKTKSPASVSDSWTVYRIGEAWLAEGRTEDALRWMQHSVQLSPGHLRFRGKYAEALIKAGKPDEAIAELNTLLRENPSFEGAWNNRGYAYVLQGDLAKAEADFLRELQLQPDPELALANLASVYVNTGRGAKAKPIVARLRRMRPGHPPYENFWNVVKDL